MDHAEQLHNLPVVSFETLWHVGSLNPHHKKAQSLEGEGLSISLHPDDWEHIAMLTDPTKWEFTKDKNTFLNYHALTTEQKSAITTWGMDNGYIAESIAYRVTWEDCETGMPTWAEYTNLTLAQEEADGLDGDLITVTVYAATTTFPDSTVHTGDINTHDILATAWVNQHTTLDGVWWEDTYNPTHLSAPRGVILLRHLHTWTKNRLTS